MMKRKKSMSESLYHFPKCVRGRPCTLKTLFNPCKIALSCCSHLFNENVYKCDHNSHIIWNVHDHHHSSIAWLFEIVHKPFLYFIFSFGDFHFVAVSHSVVLLCFLSCVLASFRFAAVVFKLFRAPSLSRSRLILLQNLCEIIYLFGVCLIFIYLVIYIYFFSYFLLLRARTIFVWHTHYYTPTKDVFKLQTT